MRQTELYPVEPDTRERDMVLLKHVNAIAIMPTKGGGKISAQDRRLFDVLLYWAQGEGNRPEYSARLHELVKLAEFNSNNTSEIKKSLKNLLKTVVEWQSPTSGEIEEWEACVLISGVSVKKDKRTGAVTISWRYDSKVQSQLLDPDRYGRLMLQASIRLRTHAAMALYGICARYVANPGHRTSKQHWRWWRPVLAGVAYEGDTGEYRYWKRDTLMPAIAEINANTELDVQGPIEYKERDNKTIAFIQFEVRPKSRVHRPPVADRKSLEGIEPKDLQVIGEALQLGVPQRDAETLYQSHGAEALAQGVQELQKRLTVPVAVATPVAKPGAWLRTMMNNKEASPSVAADPSPTRQAVISASLDLQMNKAALTEEWLRRKKDSLRSHFQELPDDEQRSLLGRFRGGLTLTAVIKRLDTSGWDHRTIRDTFASFLGETWEGPEWNKPKHDDILGLALERSTTRS